MDRDTNACKGYGFVLFDKEASARSAVQALNNMGIHTTFAKMSRAQLELQGRTPPDPTNLYFTNLPWSMNEDQVRLVICRSLPMNGAPYAPTCDSSFSSCCFPFSWLFFLS